METPYIRVHRISYIDYNIHMYLFQAQAIMHHLRFKEKKYIFIYISEDNHHDKSTDELRNTNIHTVIQTILNFDSVDST